MLNSAEIVYINKHQAAALIGRSTGTLKDWRRNESLGKFPCLRRGIHWKYLNATSIVYDRELLIDLIANSEAPELHEIAIQNSLARLLSSQSVKTSRRKAA
jgi:hypothetical protein